MLGSMACPHRNCPRRHHDPQVQGSGLSHPSAAAQLPRGRHRQERDAGQSLASARGADRDHPCARCRARPSCRWRRRFEVIALALRTATCRRWLRPCSAWASPRCSAAKPCRERDLVLAMVAARIVAPHTKLATTRWWHTTHAGRGLRRGRCRRGRSVRGDGLAARAPGQRSRRSSPRATCSAGGLVLYDLSSSYFEGTTCPLAKLGYSRDGKQGTLQVNYGLLTDAPRLPGGGLGVRGQYRRQHDLDAARCSGCASSSASSTW